MGRKLTWLHISDIHFYPRTEWRDSTARVALLACLKTLYGGDDALRPDLIFCTGDIAFGETGSSPLAEQYQQAENFFDSLLNVCGHNGVALPKERLFVVPGNHDVNRNSINSDAQRTLTTWAQQSNEYAETINQRFRDQPIEFTAAVKRLDEYGKFIESYLPHQRDAGGRHCYARVIETAGLKVGIAGFNSAWSCAGPEDDRNVWLAAEWQFNSAQAQIADADIRIGLIHHPIDWLNDTERDTATRRIASNFHFWLHGHSHNAWVMPTQSHVTIAAGAIGAQNSEEFAVNIVQLDTDGGNGLVHLYGYTRRAGDWTIAPVATHAPAGPWSFELPSDLRKPQLPVAKTSQAPLPAKRTPGLYGRETLIRDASASLERHPFLLVYGLRGNGKTVLIEALGQHSPLAGKKLIPLRAHPDTTTAELFRLFAPMLGDTDETPKPPSGDVKTIANELRQRYQNPRPAWIWIDRAHNLLDGQGNLRADVLHLLLGLREVLGSRWHWVLELREKPAPRLLGSWASECEVPGLDKASLAKCLADGAPAGRNTDWSYSGDQLKGLYQWLGGGQGKQAHPLAIQLLIEVARGHNETPLEARQRHLSNFKQKLEERLLGDLYNNVLSRKEQQMLQALALYRAAIPHDHAEQLEQRLNIPDAWDGLDRRCLLSPNAEHTLYYLHSFISSWVRNRLGYEGEDENDEADFADSVNDEAKRWARNLHSVIADCWLRELARSRRISNLSISRALEAFHHLVAAGEADHIQDIAVQLLAENLEWARKRIEKLYTSLYQTKAPTEQLRHALEYAALLDPDDPMVQRFLGECWAKEDGEGSDKALKHFEAACRIQPTRPQYWANIGRTLLARGPAGARDFLRRLEALETEHPKAIDDYVRAIQANCFKEIGEEAQASVLRMARIGAGSKNPALYTDEAKARRDTGDLQGALEVLNLAEKNGCADKVTDSMRAGVLGRLQTPS